MKKYLLMFAAVAAMAVPASFGAARKAHTKSACAVAAIGKPSTAVCDCVSYGCGLWGQMKCPCFVCQNQ